MSFRFEDLVGTYRLVVSAELVSHIERTFVEPAPPSERDAVRAEALHEAAGAELEITAERKVISRSHGQDFYCIELQCDDREYDELSFEKAPSQLVRLILSDRDTLLAHQPGKPVTVFRRV